MKTRIMTILAVVSMGCAVWLVGENRALKQLNMDLVDDYLDLQVEYEMLFDEYLEKSDI